MESSNQRQVALRLAIPFCVNPCPFCSREVIGGWDSARMHAYMEALQRELKSNAEQFADCQVVAVRLGGGTASNASGPDVADTLRLIREHYHLLPGAPVTMRAAVANISAASMPYFKRAGITRFDFEMLSLDPMDFGKYNRTDSLNDYPVVCDYFLRSYANHNLGTVLVFGHREVGAHSFRRSLNIFANSNAVHLILQRFAGAAALDADAQADQLTEARQRLGAAGFVEYVPLHFAREGSEDSYFIRQTAGAELLSFGLGAQTIIDGTSSTNTSDLATYLAHADDYTQITTSVSALS